MFGLNHNHTARDTVASFSAAGTYVLRGTATDESGGTAASNVTVTVAATPTSVVVAPRRHVVQIFTSYRFGAALVDQFGAPAASQPAFGWSVVGGGAINPNDGTFTPHQYVSHHHSIVADGGGVRGVALAVTGESLATGSVAPIPSPHNGPVQSLLITFSRPVIDFGKSNLGIEYGGQFLPLNAATLTSPDNRNFTLGNLAQLTAKAGGYQLFINTTFVRDVHNNRVVDIAPTQWTVSNVLTVNGTANDDTFLIQTVPGSPQTVEVYINGGSPAYRMHLPSLADVVVNGLAGNDRLTLMSSLTLNPVFHGGAGANTLAVAAGTHTFRADTTDPDNLAVEARNYGVVNFAASQRLRSLSLTGAARATLAAGGNRALRVTSLSVADWAALDLTNNDLILQPTTATRQAALQSAAALVAQGRNGGNWAGYGVRSSAAAANVHTGLSVVPNWPLPSYKRFTQYAGTPVNDDTILVKYTWNGDLDLSGSVTADDYFIIDSNRLSGGHEYHEGDLDFDGVIDDDDYALIDGAYVNQNAIL